MMPPVLKPCMQYLQRLIYLRSLCTSTRGVHRRLWLAILWRGRLVRKLLHLHRSQLGAAQDSRKSVNRTDTHEL